MSVLKIKDTDGTWKDIGTTVVNLLGDTLQTAVITRSSAKTFDLSPYVSGEDTFILFYNAVINGSAKPCFYMTGAAEGLNTYRSSSNTTTEGLVGSNYEKGYVAQPYSGSGKSVSYDKDTSIFAYKSSGSSDKLGTSAVLIYVG